MAEALKTVYDIAALKVELLETRPNVRFTLQANVDGKVANVERWSFDTKEMGFETPTRGSSSFGRGRAERAAYQNLTGNLPSGMLTFVAHWLAENKPDQPLWVHLVKPYGVLRFVPWERALGDALPVPILMLPDFIFPPPRESSAVLDVALCGSAPLDREEGWVHQAVNDVADRILEAQARRTRLHVFVDSALAPHLRAKYAATQRLGVDVFVHGPEKAMPYLEDDPSSRLVDRTGQLRSPWLLWMRDALRGQPVDVVHFVCHGHLTRDNGALLFAQSPLERTDRFLAGPVGQTELGTFLTQIGAWSSAFTSVIDDNSEPGLRALADGIAQSRPGPLLMNTLHADPGAAALVGAYHLLYSKDPMDAPKSSALSMYCQPYRVKSIHGPDAAPRGSVDFGVMRNVQQREAAELVTQSSSPLDAYFAKGDVLPWVASTERYVENVQLRFQHSAQNSVDDQPDESVALRQEVTMQTLDKLRSAVARIAEGSGPAVSAGDTELEARGQGADMVGAGDFE